MGIKNTASELLATEVKNNNNIANNAPISFFIKIPPCT